MTLSDTLNLGCACKTLDTDQLHQELERLPDDEHAAVAACLSGAWEPLAGSVDQIVADGAGGWLVVGAFTSVKTADGTCIASGASTQLCKGEPAPTGLTGRGGGD